MPLQEWPFNIRSRCLLGFHLLDHSLLLPLLPAALHGAGLVRKGFGAIKSGVIAVVIRPGDSREPRQAFRGIEELVFGS